MNNYINNKWRLDFSNSKSGGYVATHVLKAKDAMKRHGIAVEVEACKALATTGKKVLRLPENVFDKIDSIVIDGKRYRELLKFKEGAQKPRGYPDVYFDGQTWDFKTSSFENEDSLRQTIKDGRKADNIVFPLTDETICHISDLKSAIGREFGNREKDGSWKELPNVYYLYDNALVGVWVK